MLDEQPQLRRLGQPITPLMVRRPAQQAVSNHATDFVASGRELVVIFRFSGIFPDLSPIHPASSGRPSERFRHRRHSAAFGG
jgi:hypothetical protein